MSNFKIGDWIRVKYTDIVFKITNISTEFVYGIYKYSIYEPSKKDIEPWQPQEDEWCWFYEDGVFATIGQYGGDNGDSKHWMKSHTLDLWDSVEPFIGTLPSFIKDIR